MSGAVRLDLSYDGTDFRGYARQPSVRTVQGELEAALSDILRRPVPTVGAGRTDAGVHAVHQVASFRSGEPVDESALAGRLNRRLPNDIVVFAVRNVAADFHARFSAKSRSYRYRILNQFERDPLLRRTHWHVREPLDVAAMNAGISHFIGQHDFAAFCRRAKGKTTERTVLRAGCHEDAGVVEVRISAVAFCHQMVRSVVGLTADVGKGLIPCDVVPAIIAGRDRSSGSVVAPPHGLVLWHVEY